jgi:uncharacterized protein (TIGR00251 family)
MDIEVKVKPKSSQEGIKDLGNGKFEVRVNEVPEGGKANERVIELLSEYFKVPKSSIKIKYSQTSKNKVIVIEGL